MINFKKGYINDFYFSLLLTALFSRSYFLCFFLFPIQKQEDKQKNLAGLWFKSPVILKNFLRLSLCSNQYRAGRVYDLCVYFMTGAAEGQITSECYLFVSESFYILVKIPITIDECNSLMF